MPMITPSRVVVVAITLTLMSFLWTWGLPREFPEPQFPVVNQEGPQKQEDDWRKPPLEAQEPEVISTSLLLDASSAPQQIPTPSPFPSATLVEIATESASPSPPGQEDNKDKEGDEDKQREESASLDTATASLAPYPTAHNGTSIGNGTIASGALSTATAVPAPDDDPCKHVDGASDIMVIVKTSKAEIEEKLPTHLKTLLNCVPNFAIFSDHSGTIEGFTVHDALEDISDATKASHDEFRDYEKIQNTEDLKPGTVTKELDKWKFLPMVYKAYKMRSYSKWYIFIEADTSLSWTNLLQWISRHDYRKPYYSGAPKTIRTVKFAERGSGILLSGEALKQYAKAYEELYESYWERRLEQECCGDMVLATTMTEAHVEFSSAFPMLQGETPSTLEWTEKHWCAPVVSWHQMSKQNIETLWQHEQNWTSQNGWNEPYLFRDVFSSFVEPQLVDRKDEWDNLSSDTMIKKPSGPDEDWDKLSDASKKGVESWEKCKHACEMADDCKQWKYRSSGKGDGECNLGNLVQLGNGQTKETSEGSWTSGWILERIKTTTLQWKCDEPAWDFNQ